MVVEHKLSARDVNWFVVRECKYRATDRVFCGLNYCCYLWICKTRWYRRFNNFGNMCKEEHLSYQVFKSPNLCLNSFHINNISTDDQISKKRVLVKGEVTAITACSFRNTSWYCLAFSSIPHDPLRHPLQNTDSPSWYVHTATKSSTFEMV